MAFFVLVHEVHLFEIRKILATFIVYYIQNMEALEIEPTNPKALGIKFTPSGILSIYGVSLEEDPKPFYQRLQDWVVEYIKAPAATTILSVRLKYFNTSSSKCLFDLMKLIATINESNSILTITWYYEDGDEDMQDTIRLFEELIKHKIELLQVDSYTAG